MRPLSGFRVLDLTRFLSGPYCTMVLSELGADVVKIEQPGTGDDSRRMAPKINGESYPFAMPNRSKRSVAIDLKSDRGRELFLELAAGADLVIENFRPGVTRRLGIDYDSIRTVRDDILYCSISGFGQTGPYKDRPGFDIMAQGLGGFMRMTGEPDGKPTKVGIAINDIAAGATAIYSILAAELQRRQTGDGAVHGHLTRRRRPGVDGLGVGRLLRQRRRPRTDRHPAPSLHPVSGLPHLRRLRDNRRQHRSAVAAAGQRRAQATRVGRRPALRRPGRRMENIDELEAEIEAITTTLPTSAWIDRLDAAGVPGGPVLTYEETLADPHIQARGMVVELEHPVIGPMRTIAPPTRFSDLDFSVRSPAPWLGQHTVSVLSELGVDRDEIDKLLADGMLFDAHPELQEQIR